MGLPRRRHPRYAFPADSASCAFFIRFSGNRGHHRSHPKFVPRRPGRYFQTPCSASAIRWRWNCSSPGQPKMYMAGPTQFIRYAGRGFHEIEITLAAPEPSPCSRTTRWRRIHRWNGSDAPSKSCGRRRRSPLPIPAADIHAQMIRSAARTVRSGWRRARSNSRASTGLAR